MTRSGLHAWSAICFVSVAFDCVDHDILLNRLEKSFGFYGMAIRWIRFLPHWQETIRSSSNSVCWLFGISKGRPAPLILQTIFIPVGTTEGRSSLRSADTGQSCVPRTKTPTIGPRAFAVIDIVTIIRLLGTFSQWIFVIQISIFLVSERN